VREGNALAEPQLSKLVFAELRRLAKWYMASERPDHTLQPTALVNEAFLRLMQAEGLAWTDRKQFCALAATMMRRVLIDHARSVRAAKRGSGMKIELDSALIADAPRGVDDLLALDQALQRLAELDARQSRIVELRFFAGFSDEEVARVLDISTRTVKRDWATARAWLHSQLAETAP